MLRIVNFEEIQRLLGEISGLVDLYENKDFTFSIRVKDWLKKTEKILDNNKLAISGRIASLRASLISAEQGVISERIQFDRPPTKKKILNATASYVLQNAGEVISAYLQNDTERFHEAEKHIRQLITFIQANGEMKEFIDQTMDTETLKNMWQVIKSNPNLAQGTLNVESLVGPYDSLIIFNRLWSSAQI